MHTQNLKPEVFAFEGWRPRLVELKKKYRQADPFPHIVLENFLNEACLRTALADFPSIHSGTWIHYVHVNERKYGKNDVASFPISIRQIVEELNSDAFVQLLRELTGIEGLFADATLEGGGLHQSSRGGYLNMHADFTVHPHHRDWQRRVNLLIYLNDGWREEYGGHLEFWDKKMSHCVVKTLPLFNRAVIFNTDTHSFHGHPHPLTCPDGVTRKSMALYYFTKETKPAVRSTDYRARPGEGWKGLAIYLDKMVLRAYDFLKRKLNLSDDFASRVLGKIDRWKKRG